MPVPQSVFESALGVDLAILPSGGHVARRIVSSGLGIGQARLIVVAALVVLAGTTPTLVIALIFAVLLLIHASLPRILRILLKVALAKALPQRFPARRRIG